MDAPLLVTCSDAVRSTGAFYCIPSITFHQFSPLAQPSIIWRRNLGTPWYYRWKVTSGKMDFLENVISWFHGFHVLYCIITCSEAVRSTGAFTCVPSITFHQFSHMALLLASYYIDIWISRIYYRWKIISQEDRFPGNIRLPGKWNFSFL